VLFSQGKAFLWEEKESMHMKKSFLAVAALVGCLFAVNVCVFAADKVVGDTRDACDGSNTVKFEGKDGAVSVKRSQTQTVQLPSSTREIYWYCSGSRERSANDTPFNAVQITRASNGAIHWVFLVRTETAATGTGSGSGNGSGQGSSNDGVVRVGDTKDACDRSQVVEVKSTSPDLRVHAGEMKIGDLPTLTREVFWTCGNSNERAANDNPFNRVQIERAGNGAIQWVFYRTRTVSGPDTGVFLHNIRGDLMLAARIGNTSVTPQQPPAGFLRQSFDKTWNDMRPDFTDRVRSLIPTGSVSGLPGKLRIDSITLSDSSNAELRVAQSDDLLTLKYVIHQNRVKATDVVTDPAPDASIVMTFDIELVMPFARSQMLPGLQVTNGSAMVRHVEIEGDNVAGGIVVGLLKSKVRAEETKLGNISQDVTKEVNDAINKMLAQVTQNLSPGAKPVTLDTDRSGDVRACVKVGTTAGCNFPASSAALPQPRVLDTSNDDCHLEKIWLWDSELGRFVSVAKGSSGTLVQVDNKRFEWYCGDNSGPDPSPNHQESASGPENTYQVRVSRDGEGRAIHWQFLSWH
jgi:hypothetical protein